MSNEQIQKLVDEIKAHNFGQYLMNQSRPLFNPPPVQMNVPPPPSLPPQPKKRGRKPKNLTQQPPLQPLLQVPQNLSSTAAYADGNNSIMETRSSSQHIPTRAQSTRDISYVENSEAKEEEDEDDDGKNEGLPIKEIYCKTRNIIINNNLSNGGNININNNSNSINSDNVNDTVRYLVKMADKSPLHAILIKEQDIRTGTQSNKLLSEFNRSMSSQNTYDQIISNVGLDLIEPQSKPFDSRVFYIDQILGHRSLEPEIRISRALLNPTIHVAGLPVDNLMPSFEELLKFANPFSSEYNLPNLLLRKDGFYTVDEKKCSNIESEQIFGELPSSDEIPKKVEFRIKWKNMPISESTWESFDQMNEQVKNGALLFCPSNIDDLNTISEVYWNKTLGKNLMPEKVISSVPSEIPTMGRYTNLTDTQKYIITKIFENRIRNKNCQIIGKPECGRVFAAVSYLMTLRLLYNISRPSIIIVDENYSDVWKIAIKVLTNLYWVEFNGNPSDRMTIKNSNNKIKFDIIITTCKAFSKEIDLFSQFSWDNIIIDQIHGESKIVSLPSVFTVLLCDEPNEKFSSSQITIDEIHKFDTFHFSEEIILVPNMINTTIHTWLRHLFKNRTTRTINLRNSCTVVHEVGLSLLHPFAIPELYQQLLMEHKLKIGMNEKQILTPRQEQAFNCMISGKIQKLCEIAGQPIITAVISEDLSILRILRAHFKAKKIPAGIVNSNVADERVPDDFAYGLLLMNRDITYGIIDRYAISQIVFYDVSPSYKIDKDFVQFVCRNQHIPVYRLLTANSLETELFLLTLNEVFDYRNIPFESHRIAEQLIRVATFQSKRFSISSEDNGEASTPQQDQFSQQQQLLLMQQQQLQEMPMVSFEYPKDVEEIPKRLFSVMEEAKSDDFWGSIFVKSTNNQLTWKIQEANNLLSGLLRHGLCRWEQIAIEAEKTVDEARTYGRATVMMMISNINQNDLYKYTVASSLLWFETNNEFANQRQIEELDRWKVLSKRESLFRSQLFTNSSFSKALLGKYGEQNLRLVEENWIVRAFLAIRKPPFIPPRFKAESGNSMHSIDFIYKFLESFADNSGDWETIKKSLNLEDITSESLHIYFVALYKAVVSDLFSFILHKIYSGEKNELAQIMEIRPLLQSIEMGPFRPNWTENELKVVLDTIANFYVPLTAPSMYDWCEFHSLTRLFTKSTEAIENFATFIIESVPDCPNDMVFTIGPELTLGSPLIIPANLVAKLKSRISTLSSLRELSRNPPKVFRPQIALPKDWTLNEDISTIQGICQFGFENVLNLHKINTSLYIVSTKATETETSDNNGFFYDVVMTHPLTQFQEFVSNNRAILKRLRIVIISNLPEKRGIFQSRNHISRNSSKSAKETIKEGNNDDGSSASDSDGYSDATFDDQQVGRIAFTLSRPMTKKEMQHQKNYDILENDDSSCFQNNEDFDDIVTTHSIPEKARVGRKPKYHKPMNQVIQSINSQYMPPLTSPQPHTVQPKSVVSPNISVQTRNTTQTKSVTQTKSQIKSSGHRKSSPQQPSAYQSKRRFKISFSYAPLPNRIVFACD